MGLPVNPKSPPSLDQSEKALKDVLGLEKWRDSLRCGKPKAILGAKELVLAEESFGDFDGKVHLVLKPSSTESIKKRFEILVFCQGDFRFAAWVKGTGWDVRIKGDSAEVEIPIIAGHRYQFVGPVARHEEKEKENG